MRVWDNESEEEFEINILPMIDVIFAILAFFILSTLFLTRTEGLSVNLPDAESATPRQQADFTVTVTAAGEITLDQDPMELAELQSAVQGALEPGQAAVVTIQADEQAYHGQVIAVMDELRPLEDVQLGIATEPETSQE
ncbi:MAG: biopolymer transporter ExbD [Cyanobacteria bacterium P01_A01_bin.123]